VRSVKGIHIFRNSNAPQRERASGSKKGTRWSTGVKSGRRR
jgi:hypothetical protein